MKELEVTVRSGGLQLRQPEPVLESPLLAHTYLIFFGKKKPSLLIFFEKKKPSLLIFFAQNIYQSHSSKPK